MLKIQLTKPFLLFLGRNTIGDLLSCPIKNSSLTPLIIFSVFLSPGILVQKTIKNNSKAGKATLIASDTGLIGSLNHCVAGIKKAKTKIDRESTRLNSSHQI